MLGDRLFSPSGCDEGKTISRVGLFYLSGLTPAALSISNALGLGRINEGLVTVSFGPSRLLKPQS